jgi:hypothetical protein
VHSLSGGQIFPSIGKILGGTQDKRMSKGHLPRVVYHQVCNVYEEQWSTRAEGVRSEHVAKHEQSRGDNSKRVQDICPNAKAAENLAVTNTKNLAVTVVYLP